MIYFENILIELLNTDMVWNVGLLFISVMKKLFKNLKSYFSFYLVLKHRVI